MTKSDIDARCPRRILSSRIRSDLEEDLGDGIEVVPGSASDTGLEVRLGGRTFAIGVLEVEDPILAEQVLETADGWACYRPPTDASWWGLPGRPVPAEAVQDG